MWQVELQLCGRSVAATSAGGVMPRPESCSRVVGDAGTEVGVRGDRRIWVGGERPALRQGMDAV